MTGTDPDRLPEEKARGITIDLGFAHASWDETTFSFVDVPGHEKFVRTMVAGAQGVDLVLLAVASDDSVMPQTREHLDILKLLRVSTGVIARTKCDLVDEETGALVEDEIRALVKGSFLQDAPIVACSAVTGEGLDALKKELLAAARRVVREDRSRKVPRLFLDRAFTMKGFGPVVTGTLDAGRIAAEDALTLLPEGLDVRVRRVEVHGEERREAFTGERTSLNLAGVDRAQLRRGQALVPRNAMEASTVLTAEVAVLPGLDAPLPDGVRVRVHLGTADLAGRLSLVLTGPPGRADTGGSAGRAFAPGEAAFAQVLLESPVAARPGDRFILRRPSPAETLGGGRVLDAGRPRLKRRAGADAALSSVLSILSLGDEQALADLFLLEAGPAGLSAAHLGARSRDRLGGRGEPSRGARGLRPRAQDLARALRARVRRVGPRRPGGRALHRATEGGHRRRRARKRRVPRASRRRASPPPRPTAGSRRSPPARRSRSRGTAWSRPARRRPTSRATPRPSRRSSRSSTGRPASSRRRASTRRRSSARSRRSWRASSRIS
jgi:selenocysteine-specific elongation factor